MEGWRAGLVLLGSVIAGTALGLILRSFQEGASDASGPGMLLGLGVGLVLIARMDHGRA